MLSDPSKRLSPTLTDFREWKARSHVFEKLAFVGEVSDNQLSWHGAEGPQIQVKCAQADAAFFALLGLRPVSGRRFIDDDADAERRYGFGVAMISDSFWKQHIAESSESAGEFLGRAIKVGSRNYTVTGLISIGLVDVWLSSYPGIDRESGETHFVQVIGRLKTGVTFSQAQDDLNSLSARNDGSLVTVVPLASAPPWSRNQKLALCFMCALLGLGAGLLAAWEPAAGSRLKPVYFVPLVLWGITVSLGSARLGFDPPSFGITVGIFGLLFVGAFYWISIWMVFDKNRSRWLIALILFPATAFFTYLALIFMKPKPGVS